MDGNQKEIMLSTFKALVVLPLGIKLLGEVAGMLPKGNQSGPIQMKRFKFIKDWVRG